MSTICVALLFCLITQPNNYFLTYQHANGPIQDRSLNSNIYSSAASGFALDAYAILSEQDIITKEEAIRRIELILNFYAQQTPQTNRGWLYHFHNSDGKPLFDQEISTIETAIFYMSAKQAAQRLNNTQLTKKINAQIRTIDQQWMIDNSPSTKRFSHGVAKGKFIQCEWDENNEGVLIYRLFNRPFTPTRIRYDLPLFAYYYPLCFIHDEPSLVDHLKKAIAHQLKTYGHTGITSCDTQEGYQFYPTDYYSPLSLTTIAKYHTDKNAGLTHSVYIKGGWQSKDRIGIEEGALILLHNKPKQR